jgi:hypothetical protein
MMGEPILELQRSMVNILDRLGQQDRFNIIVFQSSFGMFESDLQNVTSENIFNAQHMINFQTPGGGTYIKTKYMISAFAYHIIRSKRQYLVFILNKRVGDEQLNACFYILFSYCFLQ